MYIMVGLKRIRNRSKCIITKHAHNYSFNRFAKNTQAETLFRRRKPRGNATVKLQSFISDFISKKYEKFEF